MQLFQSVNSDGEWSLPLPLKSQAQWILAFGDRQLIASEKLQSELKNAFPSAEIVGCTTSGEIQGIELKDESISLTALTFDESTVKVVDASMSDFSNAVELGEKLVKELTKDGLIHIFVLSDGQLVNGTELVEGMSLALPDGVKATGGLAGDGDRFTQTQVWHNQRIESGLVVLVGLYGDKLRVGHGHLGGWKAFGPERIISKSNKNVLYEFDGKPALELYKTLLGDYANDLPASALLFPIAMKQSDQQGTLVRIVLSIDESKNSMTFAGNMPEGAVCQLMRANYENLLDGANGAASSAMHNIKNISAQLAILISCIGRRLVLDQRVEEELEMVAEVLSPECVMTGFYSYGEISPSESMGACSLHNQTMTITLISEN
jgi:hypothetical protein